jgi:predicted NodU family carbamoyl transferase
MDVLGIACGFEFPGVADGGAYPKSFGHDAAACLVRDGRVVAAIEEERFNRIKHTNQFCFNAIDYCLEQANTTLDQIDSIVYYFGEKENDADLKLIASTSDQRPFVTSREALTGCLDNAFSLEASASAKLEFVRHHVCHGFAAFCNSGFDQSVVVVADGKGDAESLTVALADRDDYRIVRSFDDTKSLGRFYRDVIRAIGYDSFDEYKVMGLAPYGDPSRYRRLLGELYSLDDEGAYSLDYRNVLPHILRSGYDPRSSGGPFEQSHRDLAAALQEALEEIYLHVLDWVSKTYDVSNLCTGGGVSLNAKLNGRVAQRMAFEKTYFDPAAHDAGAAVGAALYQNFVVDRDCFRPVSLSSLYLGPGPDRAPSARGPKASVRADDYGLSPWDDYINVVSREAEIAVPEILASGATVGTISGRSEFGPRALGNRSILADPRPVENRVRINEAIKERESYRPFAPSVVSEAMDVYFEVPESLKNLDFMITVVPVRAEFRSMLGAVTHVDGTARPQSVSRASNPRFWNMISRFGSLTGVPVLLNTSFNRACEPIVQTVEDAVQTFLTTQLDYLAVDDVVYQRSCTAAESLVALAVVVPPDLMMMATSDGQEDYCIIARDFGRGRRMLVSNDMQLFLRSCRRAAARGSVVPSELRSEALRLWVEGYVSTALASRCG